MYALRGGGIIKSSKETQILFLSVKDSTIFLTQLNLYHFPVEADLYWRKFWL